MLSRFNHVRLFATLWAVACQAPLSMGFSRHAYWSGLPFPSPGDLSDPGIEPGSLALQADSLLLSHQGSPEHYGAGYYMLPFSCLGCPLFLAVLCPDLRPPVQKITQEEVKVMLSLLEEVRVARPTPASPSLSQAPVFTMSVWVGVFLPGSLSGGQAGGPSCGRQVDVGCSGLRVLSAIWSDLFFHRGKLSQVPQWVHDKLLSGSLES